MTPKHEHEDVYKSVVNRLNRIEGHVAGVNRMWQEGRPCPDILIQISALRSALDKVGRLILDSHVDNCIVNAVNVGNANEQLQELKKAIDSFVWS